MPVVKDGALKIDDVRGRDVALKKRNLVVFDSVLALIKYFSIPQPSGCGPDNIRKPGSGIRFAPEKRIRWANHVDEDHGLYSMQVARKREARGEFLAAVCVVRIGPLKIKRFFPVKKHQPDSLGIFLSAQQSRKFEQNTRTRSAVVRSHKIIQALS